MRARNELRFTRSSCVAVAHFGVSLATRRYNLPSSSETIPEAVDSRRMMLEASVIQAFGNA